MFDMRKIGRKLSTLRKERNMTQMELADRMGISFQAVSNWERGSSMPDISKLPELAEIFGVTLDELLGEKSTLVEAALHGDMEECLANQSVSAEEVTAVLPILKPSQVHIIAQNEDWFDWERMEDVLPFLSEADVKAFADRAQAQGQPLRVFLPFLNEENVKEFAVQAQKRSEKLMDYLPFMKDADVKELARQAQKQGSRLVDFLPFLNEDDVLQFALEALERGEQVQEFLPFMREKDVKNVALKLLNETVG